MIHESSQFVNTH